MVCHECATDLHSIRLARSYAVRFARIESAEPAPSDDKSSSSILSLFVSGLALQVLQ